LTGIFKEKPTPGEADFNEAGIRDREQIRGGELIGEFRREGQFNLRLAFNYSI